jgi:hypothetical protein
MSSLHASSLPAQLPARTESSVSKPDPSVDMT